MGYTKIRSFWERGQLEKGVQVLVHLIVIYWETLAYLFLSASFDSNVQILPFFTSRESFLLEPCTALESVQNLCAVTANQQAY